MGDEVVKTEEKKVETPGQGGGGGTAGGGVQTPSEADALKAELATIRAENKKLLDADEKRKRKELEDQGKDKELLELEKKRADGAEAKLAAAERRTDLHLAADAHKTEINKAGLKKMADRIDAETGRLKPLAEVLKLAEAEVMELAPVGQKTTAFGSTGGGSAAGAKDNDLVAIHALRDKAGKGDQKAANEYPTARAEFYKKYGHYPK